MRLNPSRLPAFHVRALWEEPKDTPTLLHPAEGGGRGRGAQILSSLLRAAPSRPPGDNARFPQSWLPQDSRLYYEATSIHSWFLYNHIYSRRKLVLN